MGKTLYLECNTGISGDMTVAALLDLGADYETLCRVLATVPVSGFRVQQSRVKKDGIDCCDFAVLLDDAHENHDHDMEYLYGHAHDTHSAHEHDHEHQHDHTHDHEHEHDHHHHNQNNTQTHTDSLSEAVGIGHNLEHHENDHKHHHDHDHDHEHHEHHDHEHHDHEHSHTHVHRGLAEVNEIIDQTEMTEGARTLAKRIFRILGEAEAKAHGQSIDTVHFHEVGAVDSIVDIISAAVCIDDLEIDRVILPYLCEGQGTVRAAHGILSIPVPATLNIVSAYQIPLQVISMKGELVTPTGAAIAAAIRTDDKLPAEGFVIQKTGLGAGKRKHERASILRAMLIEPLQKKDSCGGEVCNDRSDTIWKLESNVDDCSGEALGFVMEELFAAGARDVHFFPVFMKKNRPGWQINVICDADRIDALENLLFLHTTTIGIRRLELQRSVLPRESKTVETPYGPAAVKVLRIGEQQRFYPEYESVAELARTKGLPFQEVFRAVEAAAAQNK